MSDTTQSLILVSRQYSTLGSSWTEHTNTTIEEVVAKMSERARGGKASAEGYEVIEVTVQRRFHVRPVITAAEVTEMGASA